MVYALNPTTSFIFWTFKLFFDKKAYEKSLFIIKINSKWKKRLENI